MAKVEEKTFEESLVELESIVKELSNELRKNKGLTQEELAFKLGYANRSSVNKVENSREVSMKKIKLYADALETTVSYLMGWEDEVEEIEMDNFVDFMFDTEMETFIIEVNKMRNKNVELFNRLKSYMEFLKVGQN